MRKNRRTRKNPFGQKNLRAHARLFAQLERIAIRAKTDCAYCGGLSTHKWVKHIVEEAHEFETAMKRRDYNEAAEELGDLIYVSVLLGVAAQREKRFSLSQSLTAAEAKIKRRHPQIWGNKKYANKKELWETYNTIKLVERVGKRHRKPQKPPHKQE